MRYLCRETKRELQTFPVHGASSTDLRYKYLRCPKGDCCGTLYNRAITIYEDNPILPIDLNKKIVIAAYYLEV